MEERSDIVDENDRVIGQIFRDKREKQHIIRVVHVLVFNDKGKVALQLRSATKENYPRHWDSSASGHVIAGETYEQAAKRECEEELGVDLPLTFFGKDLYVSARGSKRFMVGYRAKSNGPFHPDEKEVERVTFFSLAELGKMIARGEKVHPEMVFVYKKYLEKHYIGR